MGYVAEGAASGADVAHDHKGGGAVVETFSQVGAGRFFTHRAKVVFTQNALDLVHCRAIGRGGANPGRFALELGCRLDFYRYACEFVCPALMGIRGVAGWCGIIVFVVHMADCNAVEYLFPVANRGCDRRLMQEKGFCWQIS